MQSLPPELLDITFSFLDSSEDLWILARVSKGFQFAALPPLFASYGLSVSQIDSGIVSLPGKASFLVPRIYGIRPIQKLTILPGNLPLRLSSILANMPPIPDVMICPSIGGLQSLEVARSIAPLCRATDPMIALRNGHAGYVSVSTPPDLHIRAWEPFYSVMGDFSSPTLSNILSGALLLVPSLILVAFGYLTNVSVLIPRLRRGDISARGDLVARIAAELPDSAGSLHIQALCVPEGGRLMLAKFGNTPIRSLSFRQRFRARDCPWLSPPQQKIFFPALQFGDRVEDVYVEHDRGVSCGLLFDFIRRHPSIRRLHLFPGAILPASLVAASVACSNISHIAILSAPATYIPYILSALPRVEQLTITFDALMRYRTYACALSAIDRTVQSLTLELPSISHLNDPAYALPWRANANTGMEAHLHGVQFLKIRNFKFVAADVDLLVGWLGRFPALVWMGIDDRGRLRVDDPAVLARSLADTIELERLRRSSAR